MILIKDRHFSPLYKFTYALFGKYDTYKGSTPSFMNSNAPFKYIMGNMILTKDEE